MKSDPPIMHGLPGPQPIIGRGRPKGAGCNLRLLDKLTPGVTSSCIWGCSRKKMNSIRTSAQQNSIPIKVRMLEGGLYAIWRLLPTNVFEDQGPISSPKWWEAGHDGPGPEQQQSK